MKKTRILCATAMTTALVLGACGKTSEVTPEDMTAKDGQSVSLKTDDAGNELKKSEASNDDGEIITSLDENSTLKKGGENDSNEIVTTSDDKEEKESKSDDKEEKESKSDDKEKSAKEDKKSKSDDKKKSAKDDKKSKSDDKKKSAKDDKKSKSDDKKKPAKDDKKVATEKTSVQKAEEAQKKAIAKRFNNMSKKEQENALHDETKTYVPENVQHYGTNIDMSPKVRSTNTLNDRIKVGMTLDDYNKAAIEMQTTIDDYVMLGQEKSLLLIKATDGASVITLNNNTNKISKIKNFSNTVDAKSYIKKLKS